MQFAAMEAQNCRISAEKQARMRPKRVFNAFSCADVDFSLNVCILWSCPCLLRSCPCLVVGPSSSSRACLWRERWARARAREVVSYEVTRIAIRSAFLELAAGATGTTGAAGATEVVSRTAARTPPPTHAGGQDDGSYTNSLKTYA